MNTRTFRFDKEQFSWLAALAGVLTFFFFVFKKTLLHRANISVLSHVLNMDNAFNPALPDEIKHIAYDPTPYTLLVPNQTMLKDCVLNGQMPFWNDLSGCGSPMLGDFAAFVFSPITWTLAFGRHSTYLMTQCVLVLLGVLGAMWLGKRLGLKPIAAAFAGIFFGFNPSVARFVELPSNNFLTPILVLSMLSFGAKTFWRSVLAGIICGGSIYIMHAEVAFGAVLMSWLFLLISGLIEQKGSKKEFLFSYFKSLIIAGIVGLIVAAPVLAPFVEFWSNSSCYKSVVSWSRYVQIQAMLLNLVNPCNGGESFFGGILILPLAFLGLLKRGPWVKSLGLVALLNLWLVCKIFPLDTILSVRPFNFFMPVYASPALILFLALLAAFGLQTMMDVKPKHMLKAAFFLLVCATYPYMLKIFAVPMETWQFDANHVIVQLEEVGFQTLLAFLAGLIMVATIGQANLLKQRLLMFAVIAINIWSMSPALKLALPTSQPFWFPKTDLISYMQEHPGRFVALGPHLLIPNIAAIYGLDDFRITNPFNLLRYYRFILQTGAERTGLQNFTFTADKLGKELDIAAVKWVVVQAPNDAKLPKDRFKLVKTFNGYMQLYENTRALPMAYIAHDWLNAKDVVEAMKLMKDESFNPNKKIVLESEKLPSGLFVEPELRTEERVNRISPMKMQLKVHNPQAGILVVNQSYFPGWTATVDGRDSEIMPVNGMFRGVAVPEGEHEIVFEYKPQSFRNGLLVFGGGALLLAIIASGMRMRGRKADVLVQSTASVGEHVEQIEAGEPPALRP